MFEATHTVPGPNTDYTTVGFIPAPPEARPTPPPTDGRTRTVSQIKDSLRERFGGTVVQDSQTEIGRLSTGIGSIDRILGGGLPQGRIVEVFGPESGGKSTLTLKAIAACQQQGGIAALLDGENSFDPRYAQFLGVDLDQLLQVPPRNGEETFQVAAQLVEGGVNLVVIDSVTSLLPKAVLESDSIYAENGAHALLMSQGLRFLTNALSVNQSDCVVLLTNQLRSTSARSNRAETTGGRAPKYYASLRIKMESKVKADRAEVTATLQKNKAGQPLQTAKFDIVYGKGVFDA